MTASHFLFYCFSRYHFICDTILGSIPGGMHMNGFFLTSVVSVGMLAGGVVAQEMQDPELCEAAFREYGVRVDACNEPASKPVQSGSEPSPQQSESHVFFLRGGAALSEEARRQIVLLAAVLETTPMRNTCLRLVGHSDSSGSTDANLRLSESRAQAVAAALRGRMQDAERIEFVEGAGEGSPLVGFPESSKYNRRVSIEARSCS